MNMNLTVEGMSCDNYLYELTEKLSVLYRIIL